MYLIIAIFSRILSNSFANVLQKRLVMENFSPAFINFIMYSGLCIACIPLFFNNVIFQLTYITLFAAVMGGLFGALGNSFLVKALKNGELSVLGPINAYKSVIAMIFGIFLLRELPSIVGITAVILIIAGSYFIFDTQPEGFSFNLFKREDIRYRFYALFFTALEALCIKKVINDTDIIISFVLWCLFGALFCFILSFRHFPRIKCFTKKSIFYFLMVISCMGIMQITTNYVFSKIQVSYGLALFQLSALISVLLGWKIFKEIHIVKKIFGTVIMIIGAIILILHK